MSCHLVISTWHGCYSAQLNVPECVCGVTVPQWCSAQTAIVRVSPVAFQLGSVSIKFFSSGVPVYHAVFARWPRGIPVYTGSTSGIPVYTGPAGVHWLRVRDKKFKKYLGIVVIWLLSIYDILLCMQRSTAKSTKCELQLPWAMGLVTWYSTWSIAFTRHRLFE